MDTHCRATSVIALAGALLLFAAGCQLVDDPGSNRNDKESPETVVQGLGESQMGYRLDGNGSGTIPKRNERVTLHLANRVRMNPFDEFELTDMMGAPIPANPPARYSYTGSEGARWKSRYLLNNECSTPCDHDNDGMTPPVWRTCCQIALQDGKFTCTEPQAVSCSSDEAMTQSERLSLFSSTGIPSFYTDFWGGQSLNPGEIFQGFPGELTYDYPGELAANQNLQNVARTAINPRAETMGLGFVNQPNVPDECDPTPPIPCETGTCLNAQGEEFCNPDENPTCAGTCQGPACPGGECTTEDGAPVPCELPEEPDPEQCNPQNYARSYNFTFNAASTSLPIPTLLNGIHLKLGLFGDSPFGSTPAKEIEFAIHYYEPRGPAQDAQVVVDGQCSEMSTRFEPESAEPPPPDASGDASGDTGTWEFDYYGNTYNVSQQLGPGCHPYYFSFVDGEGFVQTYPQYGVLQARIIQVTDMEGNTLNIPVPNNEQCPIWKPERQNADPACLPSANVCSSGETRPCYTGTAQTRGVGACSVGTETCVNGRWSGTCENQTLPASDDTCGDNVDNDCNGYVDDQCGTSGGDTGTQQPDVGMSPDAGTDTGMGTDAGSDGGLVAADDDDDSGGCGCRSTGDSLPTAPLAVLLIVAGVITFRRRRSRH